MFPAVTMVLMGIFNARPPNRAKPMPLWSINLVLSVLDGPLFEPLESARPLRLLQKALFLLLLATGRRMGEVASLSRQFSDRGDHLVLHLKAGSSIRLLLCADSCGVLGSSILSWIHFQKSSVQALIIIFLRNVR